MAEFSTRRVEADFAAIAAELNLKIETFENEFAQDVAREIVEASPVDTGFMRASWFWSTELQGRLEQRPRDQSGTIPAQVVLAKLSATVESVTGSPRFYLLNGAAYTVVVESRQNFIRQVANRADVIAEATVARVKGLIGG